MGVLSSVLKYQAERKRYTIDYSAWLDVSEALSQFQLVVSPITVPPLVADGAYVSPDFSQIITFFSQGLANTSYTVQFLARTNQGQIKRDDLQMQVVA